jgi:MFS family permease
MSAPLIPVAYAAAMGAAAVGALGAGIVYDRVGLRGMVVLPPLAALVPFLSFSTTPVLVWIGAVVWGVAMGVHESTMRAAVADLVPARRLRDVHGRLRARVAGRRGGDRRPLLELGRRRRDVRRGRAGRRASRVRAAVAELMWNVSAW